MTALTTRDLLDFDFRLKPTIASIERVANNLHQNTLPRFNKLITTVQNSAESINQKTLPRINTLIDKLQLSTDRLDKGLNALTKVVDMVKITGIIVAIYLIVVLVQKLMNTKQQTRLR